jgi:monoamine oxidase
LAAALRLSEMGHDVTMLEARSRPGGRIHTIREPFLDGQYAEAGAGRIPQTHELTLAYVKRFNLELTPFGPSSGAEVYYWRGTRQIVPYRRNPDLNRLHVEFTPREREAGFLGLSDLYIKDVIEEVRHLPDAGWPFPDFNRYKEISFGEFLRHRGASQDATGYLARGFEDESLLEFAHDEISRAVPLLWKIRGGNDLLPKAMAQQIQAHIRYNAVVCRIEQDSDGVRVAFLDKGVPQVLSADRVVCTIPFPVLRDIEIRPAWDKEKAAVVRGLYLSPVARVFVQTRTRVWEREGLHGFATVDQPLELWCPTHDQPGQRGILMSYIYERLAREYSAQTPDIQTERTIELYDQVHPGVRANFETATTWSWWNEPYSRGAFVMTKAGEFPHFAHVATPAGRVHFAGEHASPWPGWIQGALYSGLQAAQEVNEAG